MITAIVIAFVVFVVLLLAWVASTRSALVRLRDLAVEAGALTEQRRSRVAELAALPASDSAAERARGDAERRLAGDVAFHAAAVRAYDARLAGAPTSWIASLTGMNPLGPAAEHRGPSPRS